MRHVLLISANQEEADRVQELLELLVINPAVLNVEAGLEQALRSLAKQQYHLVIAGASCSWQQVEALCHSRTPSPIIGMPQLGDFQFSEIAQRALASGQLHLASPETLLPAIMRSLLLSNFLHFARILIIEDQPDDFEVMESALLQSSELQFIVERAGDMEDAREKIVNKTYDIFLVDEELRPGKGQALLPEIEASQPHAPILIITGHARLELEAAAVDMIMRGKLSVLNKSEASAEVILGALNRVRIAHLSMLASDQLQRLQGGR